jgi:serine/threonine protein kinase
LLREISALVDLKGNKNIIELLDVFEIKGTKKIVLSFRYEKGGDLNSLLHR